MEYFGYIYLIENKVNDKVYVGQTTDIEKRRLAHFSQTPTSKGCLKVHRDMWSLGRENFELLIIDKAFNKKELDEKEIYWIGALDTIHPKGYNVGKGGYFSPRLGTKHSQETLNKMRELKLGANNPMFGKEKTEEWRKRASERFSGQNHPLWGKKFSEESKKKMSESHKGKPRTEKQIKAREDIDFSGDKNPFFGKKHDIETRKIMSVIKKSRPKTIISPETRVKMVETRKLRGWTKKYRVKGDDNGTY